VYQYTRPLPHTIQPMCSISLPVVSRSVWCSVYGETQIALSSRNYAVIIHRRIHRPFLDTASMPGSTARNHSSSQDLARGTLNGGPRRGRGLQPQPDPGLARERAQTRNPRPRQGLRHSQICERNQDGGGSADAMLPPNTQKGVGVVGNGLGKWVGIFGSGDSLRDSPNMGGGVDRFVWMVLVGVRLDS
jgi:hypothetical protein